MAESLFVASVLDLGTISRERLFASLSSGSPQALSWCDAGGSKVSRHLFAEALIANLPDALRVTWREVGWRLRRSGQAGAPSVAVFEPAIDVFDGPQRMFSVGLTAEITLQSTALIALPAGLETQVELILSTGHGRHRTPFHQVTRQRVLPDLR